MTNNNYHIWSHLLTLVPVTSVFLDFLNNGKGNEDINFSNENKKRKSNIPQILLDGGGSGGGACDDRSEKHRAGNHFVKDQKILHFT